MKKGINATIVFGLAMAILAFVILGIITAISSTIVAGVNATQTGTYARAAAANASTGLTNISVQLPLLGTIIAFGAVIALLLAVFWFRGKGGM